MTVGYDEFAVRIKLLRKRIKDIFCLTKWKYSAKISKSLSVTGAISQLCMAVYVQIFDRCEINLYLDRKICISRRGSVW